MKTNDLRMTLLLTFLAVAVFMAGCSSSPSSGGSKLQPAPQFSLPNLEGKNISLKDLSNKVVVVDFWATWCGPCREEIPHLNRLYSELRGRGLEIVGISMDTDGPELVKNFARELRVEYPIVMGNENVVEDFGGIFGLPTTFIIDRKGNIVKKYIGLPPAAALEKTIKELVG